MAARSTQLAPAVRRQVQAYRQALKRARVPRFRLIVFGSQVKGTARRDSDIDIAVVSPLFGKDRFEEGVRLLRYRGGNFRIEPHPFHPDDFDDRWDGLAQEVKRFGVAVDE